MYQGPMCFSLSFEALCNVLVLPLLNVNVRLPGLSGLFRSKKKTCRCAYDRIYQKKRWARNQAARRCRTETRGWGRPQCVDSKQRILLRNGHLRNEPLNRSFLSIVSTEYNFRSVCGIVSVRPTSRPIPARPHGVLGCTGWSKHLLYLDLHAKSWFSAYIQQHSLSSLIRMPRQTFLYEFVSRKARWEKPDNVC
jgi:hypothetical protein